MNVKLSTNGNGVIDHHTVVSREEWIGARKELWLKEKELTRMNDALSAKRRELPWVKIEKEYLFDGPNGKVSLANLFGEKSQLIIQHFMFAPGWKEGCVGCSFSADHVDSALQHLVQNDVSFAAVSRAPFADLEAFRKRMGWKFLWVSSFENDFNYDYHVSFTKEDKALGVAYYNYDTRLYEGEESPGHSVFFKDKNGDIFHTYSTYARGGEKLLGTYIFLDWTPKGRNEAGTKQNMTDWLRHHDKYEVATHANNMATVQQKNNSDSCCSSENHQS